MLDSGLPLATETNILKELIKPPNLFRKVANLVTGDNTKYVEELLPILSSLAVRPHPLLAML